MPASELEITLGYEFENKTLLDEALTHPSLSYDSREKVSDNQRLEFLGDAVVQLVITDELFVRYAQYPEGKLTKMRARLVSREGLSKLAREVRLGEHLRMSSGELNAGGDDRDSNLCDAFEAVLGAAYIDGGLDAAETILLKLVKLSIDEVAKAPDEKNPKGQLQEILQAKSNDAPEYIVLSESGPAHEKIYEVAVIWQGEQLASGVGKSKKKAEAKAAKIALKQL